ncbi:hypothetical protein PVAP13_5NG110343 [Panicum virgatum]|uniref:Uncharacterized protein n=1 Tax=Panicum virgatum TaxID=38727 RepID=A0A8T0S926_PANVG|nr:hypothetical protein PVAP13_5NG110343 [Panicum virgatum]
MWVQSYEDLLGFFKTRAMAASTTGGGDGCAAGGDAGVGGGAAAALAAWLDTAKEDGVTALLRLQAIMVATMKTYREQRWFSLDVVYK